MLHNRYYYTAIALTALAVCSCSSDDSRKIYIPEAKTLQIRNFDLGEPLTESFHVAVEGSEYPTAPDMSLSADVRVTVAADPAKADQYNELCGTSYPLLPSDCYTLQDHATIEAGKSVSGDITLEVNARGKIKPFDTYLLPITITASEGASIAGELTTLYYLLSGAEDVWNMPLDDRSAWSVVEFSSEEASGEGSDNGHAIHAFDGNPDTFWHTQWKGGEPAPPHHIVVDMGKEAKMLGLQTLNRNHGEGWPSEITLETSLDGASWEGAGSYSLPGGNGEEFRSYLPGFKRARYFRLTITAVFNGKWSTHLAEINAISISD